jgi:hypothetical protein
MPVSPVTVFNNLQHVFQISYGALWHKWFDGEWKNEVITSPLGGASKINLVIPDQNIGLAIVGNQLVVTVEDQTKRVYYFATGTNGGWGVNELP